MELGAEAAELRAGSSASPGQGGCALPGVPAAASGGQAGQPRPGCRRRRGGGGGGGRGRGGAGWVGGGENVNPSLGVSVWQVFVPLCSEHLHYALNT